MFFSYSLHCYAYVPSLTAGLKPFFWPSGKKNFNLNFIPDNNFNFTSPEIETLVSSSFNQWGQNIDMSFSVSEASTIPRIGKNDIYFSNDDTIFGSGVVAITLVSYKEASGEILEADIVINNNANISLNQNSNEFLGNILTHEVGHFLGFAHEPTLGSTMFYEAQRGQYRLGEMDITSAKKLYGSNVGTIAGKIIGGENNLGLFGVHVLAIDQTGKIAGTEISGVDGKFFMKGLDPSRTYYLYTKPISFKPSLPTIYEEAKSNFCIGGESFRGSFFQTCLTKDEGFPKSIVVSANEVKDVGSITVRCGFDVPPAYLEAKDKSTDYLLPISSQSLSLSMSGFITDVEADNEEIETITYQVPSSIAGLGPNFNLNIALNFQNLYSVYYSEVSIYKNSVLILSTPSTQSRVLENNYQATLDQEYSVNVVPSDKVEVKIKPKSWAAFLNEENSAPRKPFGRRTLYTLDFFPGISIDQFNYADLPNMQKPYYASSIALKDKLNLYLLSFELQKLGVAKRLGSRIFANSDNATCTDAPNSYVVKRPIEVANSGKTTTKKSSSNEASPIACGSVDMSGPSGPSNGMTQMIFTFFAFICIKMQFRKRKT